MPIQDIIRHPSVGTACYLSLFVFELFMKGLSLTCIIQPFPGSSPRFWGTYKHRRTSRFTAAQQLNLCRSAKLSRSLFISFGCKEARKQKPEKETLGVKLGLFSS